MHEARCWFRRRACACTERRRDRIGGEVESASGEAEAALPPRACLRRPTRGEIELMLGVPWCACAGRGRSHRGHHDLDHDLQGALAAGALGTSEIFVLAGCFFPSSISPAGVAVFLAGLRCGVLGGGVAEEGSWPHGRWWSWTEGHRQGRVHCPLPSWQRRMLAWRRCVRPPEGKKRVQARISAAGAAGLRGLIHIRRLF
jgi:hypothetical protein